MVYYHCLQHVSCFPVSLSATQGIELVRCDSNLLTGRITFDTNLHGESSYLRIYTKNQDMDLHGEPSNIRIYMDTQIRHGFTRFTCVVSTCLKNVMIKIFKWMGLLLFNKQGLWLIVLCLAALTCKPDAEIYITR